MSALAYKSWDQGGGDCIAHRSRMSNGRLGEKLAGRKDARDKRQYSSGGHRSVWEESPDHS